ncbi:DUF935 domain-containing protein [Ochrobactrum pseudogrignonense]|uniref:DUF935 domain-containing protein n=1 Tax=Brucella pseudogrignonensis TaxID=419475 RepID=A0A7Y3T449_9HYPH|nr:DUF935 domain-containing protein [Brucella pseudogrignonensis]NNV20662.1 DUF935 domain-containing protein [Brucella pseudogrignonensis]
MGNFRDWLGNLIAGRDLTDERVGAQAGGVRQWMSDHTADGLTPVKLASILRAADQGDPEAYFKLAEDIEERDPHYLAQLATRKRSVAQLPITVKAASDSAEHKEHAEFIQGWVNEGILRSNLFDMLDAIGKGVSVLEIDWRFHRGHVTPRALTWRTQRWFTFDQADGETLLIRDNDGNQPMVPHKFIVHRSKAKSGLTIRSGIARIAVWCWMFKSFTVKDWAVFCQNYGQPIRIGKYGRGATEPEKDVLWRAVSGIAGDCAAILPREMLIEFHEVGSKSSSTDMYERRADWYDRQVSKLVLGQTTTTDAVSGGHAVAKEHRLVQEDIERSDALDGSDTLNQQLIPNMVAFNFGPQDHYPTIAIGRPDEVPLKDFAEAFDKFARHGLELDASYIRDRLGAPAPKEGGEVIGGRQPSAMDRLFESEGREPSRNAVKRLLHARQESSPTDDIIESLTDRLQEDAAGALGGMAQEIRDVLENSKDLSEAADKLARMQLDPDALAEAMTRGMALAHLAGQAALIDDLARRK